MAQQRTHRVLDSQIATRFARVLATALGPLVVIGIIESGEVRLYASIDAAMAEWGPYPTDVSSEVVVFYDDDGTWLKPIEHYAQKWYHLRPQLASVELRRAAPNDSYQDKLGYMLKHEVINLAPNPFVTSLEELRQMYPWNEDP